jgi:hypothetical protein
MWTILSLSSLQVSGANSRIGFVQIEQHSSEFEASRIIGEIMPKEASTGMFNFEHLRTQFQSERPR